MLGAAERLADAVEAGPSPLPEDFPAYLQLTVDDLDRMTPATSAVHSHAHVWYCQVRLLRPLPDRGKDVCSFCL